MLKNVNVPGRSPNYNELFLGSFTSTPSSEETLPPSFYTMQLTEEQTADVEENKTPSELIISTELVKKTSGIRTV